MKTKILTILLLATSVAMGQTYKDTVWVNSAITEGNGVDSSTALRYLSNVNTFFNGKNLTTGADSGVWLVRVCGAGQVGAVTFSGCTTNDTCYVDIVVHEKWRHNGFYDRTKYFIRGTTTTTITSNYHINFKGLQILPGNTTDQYGFRLNNAACAHTKFESCMFVDTTTTTKAALVSFAACAPLYFIDNAFYACGVNFSNCTNDTSVFYNNVVVKQKSTKGLYPYQRCRIVNNIYFDTLGTDISVADNKYVSKNAINKQTLLCGNCISLYGFNYGDIFVDSAEQDCRIKASTGASIINNGEDLSSDHIFPFNYDFKGVVIDSFDIGFQEITENMYKEVASIAIDPASQTIRDSSNATFFVVASGTNLHYQWVRSGVNIGTDNDSVTFQVFESYDGDSIQCKVVADTGDTAFSEYAILTVLPYNYVDTVYVDTTMPHTYSTYNVINRDSLTGDKTVYKEIQKAIDSTLAGTTIILRGGRYIVENIRVPTTKNGTSWNPGCYNLIQSKDGEWAIIDGNNQVHVHPYTLWDSLEACTFRALILKT